MSDPVVEVKHASKRFCRDLKLSLWYGVKDIATGLCGRSTGGTELRFGEFWAVNDVSFELRRGECLGLIGANGAGKSTLLKMLNGLIKPDTGRITMRGRIGALIELGAGFHPLLSGRENIYVNASILGMSKRETDGRLDDIIAFADIGDAIDASVKSYSSGMRVRLGFAVAAHLKPDVLLIDEVLAVGDLAFRQKCYRTVASLRRAGTAIILVAHSEQLIKSTCEHGLVLNRGCMAYYGDTNTACELHRELSTTKRAAINPTTVIGSRPPRADSRTPRIVDVQWRDREGNHVPGLMSGQPASLVVRLQSINRFESVQLFVGIRRIDSPELMTAAFLTSDSFGKISVSSAETEIRLVWDACCLAPGEYDIKVYAALPPYDIVDVVDWGIMSFQVFANDACPWQSGELYQPHRWEVEPNESKRPSSAMESTFPIAPT